MEKSLLLGCLTGDLLSERQMLLLLFLILVRLMRRIGFVFLLAFCQLGMVEIHLKQKLWFPAGLWLLSFCYLILDLPRLFFNYLDLLIIIFSFYALHGLGYNIISLRGSSSHTMPENFGLLLRSLVKVFVYC